MAKSNNDACHWRIPLAQCSVGNWFKSASAATAYSRPGLRDGEPAYAQRQLMRELMLRCIILSDELKAMRTTVTIDDELYQKAIDAADPGMDKADLFREAMKVFVRVQAGKRLAALGGAAPNMKAAPRRRPAEQSPP